jgi:1,4-alpha-glucan branching enzyme
MLLQGQEFLEGGGFNDWQPLEWEKAEKFKGIVQAHAHLIALRKNQHNNTIGLTGQCVNVIHLNEESKVLAYHRWEMGGPGDDVMVIINFTNEQKSNYFVNFPRDGAWQVRFNSAWEGYSPDFKDNPVESVESQNGNAALELAPYSVLILSQNT